MDAPRPTFKSLTAALASTPTPLLPPGHSHNPSLTATISDAALHPSIEALLHILNLDLPSAHFLVRHMQAAPAYEGMYIHGLLHRVEGDYNNCRAWYGDVCMEDCFINFWGHTDDHVPKVLALDGRQIEQLAGTMEDQDGDADRPRLVKDLDGNKVPSQRGARAFVGAIQDLKRTKTGSAGYAERKALLERVSRAEIDMLMAWCVDQFGTDPVLDATKVWVRPGEEHRRMGEEMTSAGKGRRDF